MAAKIGKDAEDRILRGLRKVAGLVRDGQSPSDAIIKVASEDRLPPGHVQLMVNAYNTGRTTQQRTANNGLLDKAAEFDLADPVKIIKAIYPDEVKTAAARERATSVSAEYDAPPTWAHNPTSSAMTKLASAEEFERLFGTAPTPYGRDEAALLKRAASAERRLDSERERHQQELSVLRDKTASLYADLLTYFRTPGGTALVEARANCEALYGDPARAVFNKLAGHLKEVLPQVSVRVKRAGAVDRTAAPYYLVETLIKSAQAYHEAFQVAAQFERDATRTIFKLARALNPQAAALPADPGLSLVRRVGGEKRAFSAAPAGMAFGAGETLGRSIMSKLTPKSEDKLKSDALEEVTDPSHESQLRAIRAQAQMHELLNSPYFEGEDPQQLTGLYNKLTRTAPRLVDQPLALEAIMRRHMAQGMTDVHDLDQILGMEHKVKERDEPYRKTEAPRGDAKKE